MRQDCGGYALTLPLLGRTGRGPTKRRKKASLSEITSRVSSQVPRSNVSIKKFPDDMYQVFSFQSSKGCFNLFPTPHHDRDVRLSNSANCGLWSAPPNHFHGKLEGTHWGPHLENICNTFGAHCQRVSHALEHKDINCTSMQHFMLILLIWHN